MVSNLTTGFEFFGPVGTGGIVEIMHSTFSEREKLVSASSDLSLVKGTELMVLLSDCYNIGPFWERMDNDQGKLATL